MSISIAQELIAIARYAAMRHWCPATGGNFSARIDNKLMAITASGGDKGELTVDDILTVDLSGNVIRSERKSSAETLLHAALYELDSTINAVLHVHTVPNTVLSRYHTQHTLALHHYEMFKPLRGITTHDMTLEIPIFDNTQDMQALAQELKNRWSTFKNCYCFLVRGHGCYAWGNSISEAKRHLEALEFLFACELETLKLKP
jgi:methylthioribulose-1-phosphate dehydratase